MFVASAEQAPNSVASCRLLFHLLFHESLIEALGFISVSWRDFVDYQSRVILWAEKIVSQHPIEISPDNYRIRPVKRGALWNNISCLNFYEVNHFELSGRMSSAQVLALATAQNTLGWSRTRFWTKSFQLSDLALCALAEHNALLVGTSESRM